MSEVTLHRAPFTHGAIVKPFFLFMLPIMLAQFLQVLYGAVDLIVIGHFIASDQVQQASAAVGTGSMIMTLLNLVITGLTMGTTVVLGQRIGAQDRDGSSKVVGSAFCIFIVFSLIVTIIMEIFAPVFASLMNAPSVELTALYIRVCSIGIIFITFYNVIGGIFRATGDSRNPLIFVTIACCVNIILDIVLVTVFGMGVAGVAIATITAQALSVFFSLFIMIRKDMPFETKLSYLRFHRPQWKEILHVGLPLATEDFLTNMSFIVINAIANKLGGVPSLWAAIASGYAIDNRLTTFFMILPLAFLQAMSVFTAQNMGAHEYIRIRQAFRYMIVASLLTGLLLAGMGFFGGSLLSSIFTDDPDSIYFASIYLKGFALDSLVCSLMLMMMGLFNGSGHSTFVMLSGMFGAFVVRIPLVVALSRWEDVTLLHVGIGCAMATWAQLLLCIAFYLFRVRKQLK